MYNMNGISLLERGIKLVILYKRMSNSVHAMKETRKCIYSKLLKSWQHAEDVMNVNSQHI